MNTRSNAKSATPGEQGDVPKQVNGPQITLENGTEVDIRNTKSLRDLLEGDDELSEDDLRIMAKSIGIENAARTQTIWAKLWPSSSLSDTTVGGDMTR